MTSATRILLLALAVTTIVHVATAARANLRDAIGTESRYGKSKKKKEEEKKANLEKNFPPHILYKEACRPGADCFNADMVKAVRALLRTTAKHYSAKTHVPWRSVGQYREDQPHMSEVGKYAALSLRDGNTHYEVRVWRGWQYYTMIGAFVIYEKNDAEPLTGDMPAAESYKRKWVIEGNIANWLYPICIRMDHVTFRDPRWEASQDGDKAWFYADALSKKWNSIHAYDGWNADEEYEFVRSAHYREKSMYFACTSTNGPLTCEYRQHAMNSYDAGYRNNKIDTYGNNYYYTGSLNDQFLRAREGFWLQVSKLFRVAIKDVLSGSSSQLAITKDSVVSKFTWFDGLSVRQKSKIGGGSGYQPQRAGVKYVEAIDTTLTPAPGKWNLYRDHPSWKFPTIKAGHKWSKAEFSLRMIAKFTCPSVKARKEFIYHLVHSDKCINTHISRTFDLVIAGYLPEAAGEDRTPDIWVHCLPIISLDAANMKRRHYYIVAKALQMNGISIGITKANTPTSHTDKQAVSSHSAVHEIRQAIYRFQRQHGLHVNHYVDTGTWAALLHHGTGGSAAPQRNNRVPCSERQCGAGQTCVPTPSAKEHKCAEANQECSYCTNTDSATFRRHLVYEYLTSGQATCSEILFKETQAAYDQKEKEESERRAREWAAEKRRREYEKIAEQARYEREREQRAYATRLRSGAQALSYSRGVESRVKKCPPKYGTWQPAQKIKGTRGGYQDIPGQRAQRIYVNSTPDRWQPGQCVYN